MRSSSSCRAAHDRYFQLKQLDKQARQSFVEKRSGAYTSCVTFSSSLHLSSPAS